MVIEKGIIDKINTGNIDKDVLDFLNDAIKKIDVNKYNMLDKYYINDKNILKKNRILTESANNIILANFPRYITELNVGYFMSKDISYNVNNNVDIQDIIDLYNKNTIIDIDKSNAKKLSKYGKAYEINYIDENTEIKTKSLKPTEAIVFKSNNLEEKEVLGLYFVILDEKRYKLYLFTNNKRIEIITDFTKIESIEEYVNLLNNIPIIEVKNNEEAIGDYENIISLIDAYNKVISNDIDNIEEFIDSILLLYGARIDTEQMKLLRETRGLNLDREAKAEYLTKVLDETGISMVLERLRKDIHKFSFTPDMSDENFAGNSSGVALAYKLLPFELLAQTKQSQYEILLKKRFRLYSKYLNMFKNIPEVDITEIEIVFTRGLPKNDVETANMIAALQGMVTNKTLISNLSFIKNANEEEELLKEEKQNAIVNQQKAMMGLGVYKEDEEQEEQKE